MLSSDNVREDWLYRKREVITMLSIQTVVFSNMKSSDMSLCRYCCLRLQGRESCVGKGGDIGVRGVHTGCMSSVSEWVFVLFRMV